MKNSILFILLASLVACNDKPSFESTKRNFLDNKLAFTELSNLGCKLGKAKQSFSHSVEHYSYSPSKIDSDNRIIELDILLKKVGGYVINYEKLTSGKCNLEIGYYSRGFGGSGISYNYTYQKQNIVPYESKMHSFEEIVKSEKRVNFDVLLEGAWYFSFSYN